MTLTLPYWSHAFTHAYIRNTLREWFFKSLALALVLLINLTSHRMKIIVYLIDPGVDI